MYLNKAQQTSKTQKKRSSSKKNVTNQDLLAISGLIALSACGGGSETQQKNLVLDKVGDKYNLTEGSGITLVEENAAVLEVKNNVSEVFPLPFQADGTGTIQFNFTSPQTELSFPVGTKICGFDTIQLKSGVTDLSDVEIVGSMSLKLSSDAHALINFDQISSLAAVIADSLDSELLIKITSEDDLNALMNKLSSSSLPIYAITNPIRLELVSNSQVSQDVLNAAQLETYLYVQGLDSIPSSGLLGDNIVVTNTQLILNSELFQSGTAGNIRAVVDSATNSVKFSKDKSSKQFTAELDSFTQVSVELNEALEISAADLSKIDAEIIGEGSLVLTGVSLETDLTSINVSGTVSVSGEVMAGAMVSLDLRTKSLIDATEVTKAVGSASEVRDLVDDQSTIDTASNVDLITSGATADISDLALIAKNTTGFVNALAHIRMEGTVEDAQYIFVTENGSEGDKIQLNSAVAVTLSDADNTLISAAELSAIGGATTGEVTLTNKVDISGSSDEVEAALVTLDTKVSAQNSNILLDSATTGDGGADYLAQLVSINASTEGDIVLTGTGAATILNGSAQDTALGLDGITTHTGNITLTEAVSLNSGIDYLAQLVSINSASTGTITLTGTAATTDLQGSANDLDTGLTGITTHSASTLVNSATTSNLGVDYLEQLKSINLSTSGIISLTNTAATTVLKGSAEDLAAALNGITTHTADVTIDSAITINSGLDYREQLSAVNAATTGAITLSGTAATASIQGSSSDLASALDGISTHTGNVIVNAGTSNAATFLDELKIINDANQGSVLLANTGATAAITGTSDDLISALAGVSDYIGTATITNRLNVSDADTIAGQANAVFSSGIGDTVSNLVNSDSSDISTNLQNALIDDIDLDVYLTDEVRVQNAVDIDLIEEATSGTLHLSLVNEITLAAAQSLTLNASTVSGNIVTFNGTGNNLGETVAIIGSSSDDVVDLTYITVDGDDIQTVTLDTAAGNDNISDSAMDDVITGGYGADQISLQNGGADSVVFKTSGDGAPLGSPNGADTVTHFDRDSGDKIIISDALALSLDDNNDGIFQGLSADTDINGTQDFDFNLLGSREYFFIDNDGAVIISADLTNTTSVADICAAELNLINSSVGEELLIGLESSTDGTYGLYYFSDTELNTGTIDPEEISILAIIESTEFSHGYFEYSFA